jgi:hypothetical protein
MEEPLETVARLLSDVILPNLKSVHASQQQQIAANERIENEIAELRLHINAQFAHLVTLMMACRAEIAATQAILKTVGTQSSLRGPESGAVIH